ncbi:MAG: hypothetical protein R3C05_20895 [Pirellulaceae bacterium]
MQTTRYWNALYSASNPLAELQPLRRISSFPSTRPIILLLAALIIGATGELRAEEESSPKAPKTPRPALQIINASAEPIDVIWIDGSNRRKIETVDAGGDKVIATTIGHRFEIVPQDSSAKADVVSKCLIQGFRFDPSAKDGVPKFYTQTASAGGFPVVASETVNPFALQEAVYLLNQMLREREDVRQALIDSGARLCIIAHDEFTTDLPEFAHMGNSPVPGFPGLSPKDFWDARARGTGGSPTDPFCSCGEENLLAYEGDPYHQESILIHEFAHCIHLRGMANVDPTFDDRLRETYEEAMKAGLWAGKYASVNHHEYFAEGVQSWFDNNRENDLEHNHVNTRDELLEYDPKLAAMCREVFGSTNIAYTKPTTRLRDHMAGYNPATAPKFRWPERLEHAKIAIRKAAQERADKAK